jgi:soluble lytic murein transglycosylase-like protein
MALPAPVGKAPRLSLDDFVGVTTINKKAYTDGLAPKTARDIDPQPSRAESTRDKSQSNDSSDDTLFDPGAAFDDEAAAPLPPKPKPVVERSREEICDTLTKAAHSNDVPVPFFIRLLFQESRFKPGVVSSAGAEGIAQFMPETSASVGLDNPFDPLQAIPAAARLLRNLAQRFGNLGLAAAAYNAGPKRIQDWLANKGKLPQETQGYVRTITGRAPETFTVASSGSPALKLPRHAPCQEAAGLLAWNGPERIPMPPVPRAKKDAARFAAAAEAKRQRETLAQKTSAQKTSAHKTAAKVASGKASKTRKEVAKLADKKTPAHSGKAAIAQIAAARHKHAHRSEKVAQN